MNQERAGAEPDRVAVISLHTSPQDQPGTGDSGGMNVYILQVAERLAEQGVGVDVFTRCSGRGVPEVEEISPGNRIIQVQAGPCASVPKEELPRLLPQFLDGVLTHAAARDPTDTHGHSPYDVVHSHYWLSGWVGARAKEIWGAPHVASFHTLGRVKNSALGAGDRPEPAVRLDGEEGVVRKADRILAPTPSEVDHLVGLYGADPHRVRLVPPGVDGDLFTPRPPGLARARLGLGPGPVVLFVGRLQPLKGPDVAIRAMAQAVGRSPEVTADAVLVVIGGPSGPGRDGEVGRLQAMANAVGLGDRVRFHPPQRHARLADFYSAADLLLMPSRSESFGLVSLEAQACGTPVVATATGGLRYAVRHGVTGFLVGEREPSGFADGILAILADPSLAARLSRAATAHAGRFTWEATAQDVQGIYREVFRESAGGRAA